jgi:hypothetical protein
VGPALPVLEVVLAEVLVEQRCVGGGEVPVDPLACQPLVQVPGRGEVGLDRLLLIRAPVPVVDGAQVVLELSEHEAPAGQRDTPAGWGLLSRSRSRCPGWRAAAVHGERALQGAPG